jgi:hypothetical protein
MVAYREGDVQFHSFLTTAIYIYIYMYMGAWSISGFGRFVIGNRTQVPTGYDLDRPHMIWTF